MRTSPSHTYAAILHGYLSLTSLSDLSDDAGITDLDLPSTTELPRRLMDDGAEMSLPQITIRADETGSTSARRVLAIEIRLCTTLRQAATDAVSQSRSHTRADADEIMDIIERRLRHHDAFTAYVEALSSDDRQGWTLISRHVGRLSTVDRDAEKLPPSALILTLEAGAVLAWAA
ncbi:MAG: hypothetical protein KCHDKBKB_03009 [Elusimicrobia bacterium]|nr:hypothetical protein [Elusimicrobiota bacterium]